MCGFMFLFEALTPGSEDFKCADFVAQQPRLSHENQGSAASHLYVENACRKIFGGAVVVGSWEIPAVALAMSTDLKGSDALGSRRCC